MAAAALVVAILALVVAVVAVLQQWRSGRRADAIRERLLAIEEGRESHEAERRRMVNEAAADLENERRKAVLTVAVAVTAENASRAITMRNNGAHDAVVTGLKISRDEGGAVFMATFPDPDDRLPITVLGFGSRLVRIEIMGSGPTAVAVAWDDGAGHHDATFQVDLPHRRG